MRQGFWVIRCEVKYFAEYIVGVAFSPGGRVNDTEQRECIDVSGRHSQKLFANGLCFVETPGVGECASRGDGTTPQPPSLRGKGE